MKSDLRYQFLENGAFENADIVVVPIPYEETVSAKGGTKEAPLAILEASGQIEYYEEELDWSPMKYMNLHITESISKYGEISSSISTMQLEDKLLISLGGEHSITPKITSEVLSKGATVVFLDAHADLRESYLGNPDSHATPAHHILSQGHKMIMVGVRSLFESEAKRIKEEVNLSYYSDRSLRSSQMKQKLLQELCDLEGEVYLSVDMDVFNPALVPGVGTPQPGGLDWYDALEILEAIFLESKAQIKGVDIVELVPEASQVSQVFAAKMMQKIISFWGKSKGFDTKDMKGAQMKVSYS